MIVIIGRFSEFSQTAVACVSAMSFNPMKKHTVKTASMGTLYRFRPDGVFAAGIYSLFSLSSGRVSGLTGSFSGQRQIGLKQRPAIEAAVSEPVDAAASSACGRPRTETPDKFEIRHLIVHPGDTIGAHSGSLRYFGRVFERLAEGV